MKPTICLWEFRQAELPTAHLSLLRRHFRSQYGLAPRLSRTLSSLMKPVDSSYWQRLVRSNRSQRVVQRSPPAGRWVWREWMGLFLVREDAGNSCVSGSGARLQYQGRRCLRVLEGVFSRLSTGSSSHGHGGKLRFKIIDRLRNRSILGKFSSLAEHLSSE